jgi:hypothetical protein
MTILPPTAPAIAQPYGLLRLPGTRVPALEALAPRPTFIGYPTNASAQKAVDDLAAALFRNAQTPLVAHHRRMLAAYFKAMNPSAQVWAEFCQDFAPDRDQETMDTALALGITQYRELPEPVKNKLRKAFSKQCESLRCWSQLLLGWIEQNETRVIDHASPEQLDELDRLTAHVEELALPAGFQALTRHRNEAGELTERVLDGRPYAVITRRNEHVEATYEQARRCFTYQTPLGEHGAIPYSEVTHFKPLH